MLPLFCLSFRHKIKIFKYTFMRLYVDLLLYSNYYKMKDIFLCKQKKVYELLSILFNNILNVHT